MFRFSLRMQARLQSITREQWWFAAGFVAMLFVLFVALPKWGVSIVDLDNELRESGNDETERADALATLHQTVCNNATACSCVVRTTGMWHSLCAANHTDYHDACRGKTNTVPVYGCGNDFVHHNYATLCTCIAGRYCSSSRCCMRMCQERAACCYSDVRMPARLDDECRILFLHSDRECEKQSWIV